MDGKATTVFNGILIFVIPKWKDCCFVGIDDLSVVLVVIFCFSSFHWPGLLAVLCVVTMATLRCGFPSSLVNPSLSSCMFTTTTFCTTEKRQTDLGWPVVSI